MRGDIKIRKNLVEYFIIYHLHTVELDIFGDTYSLILCLCRRFHRHRSADMVGVGVLLFSLTAGNANYRKVRSNYRDV